MFGRNLKYLREKAGYEQSYLAERLGRKSSSSVSQWESGDVTPSTPTIIDLALLFNVSTEDLMNIDLRKRDQEGEINKSKTRMIPILGDITSNINILSEENIESYFEIDESIKSDFCLRVSGDSMIEEGINYGDIAFFRQQSVVTNGDIGAVLVKNDGEFMRRASLKKITVQGEAIILTPANSAYDTMVFKKDDVRTLGKLVATVHYYD